MKNVMTTFGFVFVASLALGQSFHKGNLVGLHVLSINLNPDVTLNQYKDFFINTVIPEFEKIYGAKIYLAKGIRGESNNSLAWIFIYESEAMRDKFYNNDGNHSDIGQVAWDKMQPTMDRLNKLGTSTTKYTDWVVQ